MLQDNPAEATITVKEAARLIRDARMDERRKFVMAFKAPPEGGWCSIDATAFAIMIDEVKGEARESAIAESLKEHNHHFKRPKDEYGNLSCLWCILESKAYAQGLNSACELAREDERRKLELEVGKIREQAGYLSKCLSSYRGNDCKDPPIVCRACLDAAVKHRSKEAVDSAINFERENAKIKEAEIRADERRKTLHAVIAGSEDGHILYEMERKADWSNDKTRSTFQKKINYYKKKMGLLFSKLKKRKLQARVHHNIHEMVKKELGKKRFAEIVRLASESADGRIDSPPSASPNEAPVNANEVETYLKEHCTEELCGLKRGHSGSHRMMGEPDICDCRDCCGEFNRGKKEKPRVIYHEESNIGEFNSKRTLRAMERALRANEVKQNIADAIGQLENVGKESAIKEAVDNFSRSEPHPTYDWKKSKPI
jgi:hypothetical protein